MDERKVELPTCKAPSWLDTPLRKYKEQAFYEKMKKCKDDPNCSISQKTFGSIRVMGFNIHNFYDIWDKCNIDELLADITLIDADFVLIQELKIAGDGDWGDQFLEGMKKLGFANYEYIECIADYSENVYGNAIFSKYSQIPRSWGLTLETENLHERRGAVGMEIRLTDDINVNIICTHLEVYCDDLRRIAQFNVLHEYLVANKKKNCIIVGDFNSMSRSVYRFNDAFESMKKIIDADDAQRGEVWIKNEEYTTLGYVEKLHGYRHVHSLIPDGEPPYFTHWSGKIIDHALVSSSDSWSDKIVMESVQTLHTPTSDHIPLIVDFRLKSK